MKTSNFFLALAGVCLASCSSASNSGDPGERTSAIRAALANSNDVLGFEVAGDWSTTTAGAALSLSPVHTQGASSLAVRPSASNGWTPLLSVPLSTLASLSPELAVDVMLPTAQANPYWLGAVQAYLTCPSHQIYNAFLAQVELTGEPLGVWTTLTFPLTTGEVQSLLSSGYSDLTVTLVLNVAVPTSGQYLFDNLRFVPLGTGECAGQPNGASCDDGSACTQLDMCQGGVCTGTAKSCAAADQCHQAGVCDPTTGVCSTGAAVADSTPCNDGDRCMHAKACQGGVCRGGQQNCDDGDFCTSDSCDPGSGTCQFTPLATAACTGTATAAAPPLQGRVSFTTESDNNRCVPDPHHVINRLNAQGELMAWHYDHAGYAQLDGEHFHTETMIRMPYLAGSALDGSVFVSAWSHPPDSGNGSVMGVAQLQFKHGNQGKLLGTNRAFNGANGASDWVVTPNPGDTFMPIGPNRTPGQVLDTVQTHPGGGSALGTHVVMGLQGFDDACACSIEGVTITFIDSCGCTLNSSLPLIQIWDLKNPLTPVRNSTFLSHVNTTVEDEFNASILGGQAGTSAVSTAITKLNDGHFLLAVLKDSPSHAVQIEFYMSVGTSLDDPALFGAANRLPDAVVPFGHPSSQADLSARPPDWQSFNFMTGCDGSLSVLGTRGDDSGYPDGDAVDNYQVLVKPAGSQPNCTTPLCVSMIYAADVPTIVDTDFHVLDAEGTKHMFCPDNSGTDQCDMTSGAGSYIDPNGEVVIYSSNYDDDGGATQFVYGNGAPFCTQTTCNTYSAFSGYIRGKEFHERHGNLAPASACPTLADAWVELYSNPNYNDFGDDTGQIYRVDYPSRDERPNSNIGFNDFADKATSVRWCIPQGSSFAVYRGTGFSGSKAVLNGTGQVIEIADFSQGVTYPQGGGSLNDSITSCQFQANVTDTLAGLKATPDNTN